MRHAALPLALAALLVSAARAQDATKKKLLTKETFMDMESVGSPAISPDGTKVLFTRGWIDPREAAQLTHLERGPETPRWSPDGKKIAFTLLVPDKKPALEVKLPDGPAGAQRAKPPVVIDRLAWALDGKGPLPPGNTHLF